MTTTADWLHVRFGHPLIEIDADESETLVDIAYAEADLVALQKAYAAAPLSVQFVGR